MRKIIIGALFFVALFSIVGQKPSFAAQACIDNHTCCIPSYDTTKTLPCDGSLHRNKEESCTSFGFTGNKIVDYRCAWLFETWDNTCTEIPFKKCTIEGIQTVNTTIKVTGKNKDVKSIKVCAEENSTTKNCSQDYINEYDAFINNPSSLDVFTQQASFKIASNEVWTRLMLRVTFNGSPDEVNSKCTNVSCNLQSMNNSYIANNFFNLENGSTLEVTVKDNMPTPTPGGPTLTPTPQGFEKVTIGDEPMASDFLIPGVSCGVVGGTDQTKAKCCVPKEKDNSLLKAIEDFAKDKPIIGDVVSNFMKKYKEINALSQTMEPCISPAIPSTPRDLKNPNCTCIPGDQLVVPELNSFCTKYFQHNTDELSKCNNCILGSPDKPFGGFYTSIGCIPLKLETFITKYVFNIGIGIAGGLALLCIIYSAFRMQTSLGNPEAIKKAQENLTACITGLIIIIFSVLILKIIGVDILRIPGLN